MNITMSDLKHFLNKHNFFLNPDDLALIESALKQRVPIMLTGLPGVGKTEFTRLFAKYINAEYIFFQCTLGTNEDDLIYKLLPSEETKSGIKIVEGPLPEALRKSKNKKVVLVLDEYDKTRPTTDAILLDFLQNFRITTRFSEEKIIEGNKDNIYVFLTSNEERTFSEPLLRRVARIELTPINENIVKEMLRRKFDEKTANVLTRIYTDTLKAELEKPATIQELFQLGQALDSGVRLSKLLRTYIIKSDHDLSKFIKYLEDPVPMGNKNEEDIIDKYYNIDNRRKNQYYMFVEYNKDNLKELENIDTEVIDVNEKKYIVTRNPLSIYDIFDNALKTKMNLKGYQEYYCKDDVNVDIRTIVRSIPKQIDFIEYNNMYRFIYQGYREFFDAIIYDDVMEIVIQTEDLDNFNMLKKFLELVL